jgi:hypothetical protein
MKINFYMYGDFKFRNLAMISSSSQYAYYLTRPLQSRMSTIDAIKRIIQSNIHTTIHVSIEQI